MTLPLAPPLAVAARRVATPAAAMAAAHVPALDGVRGLAIALVLTFHFTWTFPDATPALLAVKRALWSGWIGVDLFFVLSGYLITRGLVAPSTLPLRARLARFWARRVLRIFPLYYAALAVGSLAALAAGGAVPGLAYWLYGQNYALAFDADPLAWTAHLWSLAVEEQFYFVWPLAALLVPARARLPFAAGAFVVGAAARAALVLGVSPWDAATTAKLVYRATATHMDGLLAGAAVAMMAADPTHPAARAWARVRRVATPLLLGAFVAFVVATKGFGTYDRRVLVLGYPLLALAAAAAVDAVVTRTAPARIVALLEGRPLAALGTYSYGVYVFHWPVVALAAPALSRVQEALHPASAALASLVFLVVGSAFTVGLAVVSYHGFERRFLRQKARFADSAGEEAS